VLSFTPTPSYKSIRTILSTGRDKLKEETVKESKEDYGFTRGAGYYGRRK